MKKLCLAILALVIGAYVIAPVSAVDCWGRDREFIDGNVVFYGQKVVVTTSSYLYSFMPIETYENCTVTVTTNGAVKVVTEDGKQIRSTNGFGFTYGTSAFFWKSAWNNIPKSGKNPVKHVESVDADFFNFIINSVCNGINYTEFPETITYGDMTFELSLPQVFGYEGYEYDYYWRTSNDWCPYINILGAGEVKPYDSSFTGDIYSESKGYLTFTTFEEFKSALNNIDDAYEVAIYTEDSNDWRNNFCIDIALHW